MFLAVAAALKTIGCTKRNGADIPPTTGLHQQTNAVYYWKTAFKLSEQEKDFLQKEKIGRICLHMFDVTVNKYGAVPNASVSFGTTVPSYIENRPDSFYNRRRPQPRCQRKPQYRPHTTGRQRASRSRHSAARR